MAVLWVGIPKLARVVVSYSKKSSKRVGFFRKLKKELESIAKAVVGGKEGHGKSAGETGNVEESVEGREG